VLSAAADLFAEKGQIGFTLPEIARRADVSVGTIYRRFASKEELLMAVFDRIREHEDVTALSAWADEDWSGMTIRDMCDRLVDDVSQIWRDQEPLMRSIMARRLTVGDDVVFEHGLEDIVRGAAQFERAILASRRTVAHSDPHAAIEFAYRMIVGMSARWTARDVEAMAPEPLSWSMMLERLSDAVARYLFGLYEPFG
jgi:AcrR family transcriptional regulator